MIGAQLTEDNTVGLGAADRSTLRHDTRHEVVIVYLSSLSQDAEVVVLS